MVVGGVMFLARPRHYGVAVLAGVSAVASGIIGDQIAMPVFFAIKHVPFTGELFTQYFTRVRPMFLIGCVCAFAAAAGLTALRITILRGAERVPAGARPGPWPPAPSPAGHWGPPYGVPHNQVPHNQVTHNQPGPYGPPGQPPFNPPPQPPYGR